MSGVHARWTCRESESESESEIERVRGYIYIERKERERCTPARPSSSVGRAERPAAMSTETAETETETAEERGGARSASVRLSSPAWLRVEG